MKLSKEKSKLHAQALTILEQDVLSETDKEFVLNNWHEGALGDITKSASFFTPLDMAWDFAYELDITANGDNSKKPYRIIDLCAGIGVLSYTIYKRYANYANIEIVCVEQNPDYVAVGKKLLPEATWVCASVGDIEKLKSLGSFHYAVSNPPFGKVATMKDVEAIRYGGSESHYKVVDIASCLAQVGFFILPQNACPFKLSGQQCYEETSPREYIKFNKQTNIEIQTAMGVDTSFYSGFKETKFVVEFVLCEFLTEHSFQVQEEQMALFG